MKLGAVIVAAGRGERLGNPIPKAHLLLGEKPLFQYSLDLFLNHSQISEIVLVTNTSVSQEKVKVIEGGARRQDSVEKGLMALSPDVQGVLIHDAARPFLTAALIDRLSAALREGNNAIAALPVLDTVKEADGGKIIRTVDRKTLWRAQTPQAFFVSQLKEAFAMARKHSWEEATDEAFLIEKSGGTVYCVEGDARNLKITTPADWEWAEIVIARPKAEAIPG